MKNVFSSALLLFASVASAQCGEDGRGCGQNIAEWNAVDTKTPDYEIAQPGVYQPMNLAGPDRYKAELQFGSRSNRNVRVGYGEDTSYGFRRACCKSPVIGASGECNCGKTVRRCRNRAVTGTHTETRYDSQSVDVPTAHYQTRLMPTTVMAPVFKTVKVPVKAYVTKHRIEYRNQLMRRPPSVVFKSHSPVSNMVSDCSCYQPTCGCAGMGGCDCSWPACSCAPQSSVLSTNYHTTGKNRSYVRKVPVKVPYQEEVIKYIDQKIAINRPQTVLRHKKVLTNGSKSVNVIRGSPVVSKIPGTVQECWNEYVFSP